MGGGKDGGKGEKVVGERWESRMVGVGERDGKGSESGRIGVF